MKTALITGASGDIGRAIVEKFINSGYFVFGQYNTQEKSILDLKKSLEAKGFSDNFQPVKVDLSDLSEIDRLINDNKRLSRVDVLVNNAGIGLYKLILDTLPSEWDKVFSVNMKGAYYLTNKILPSMIDKKQGKIINVSSMWGKVGASMEVAYSASKSALIGYTKALAKELAPSNINVNCVCPGVINTTMNSRFSSEEIGELIDQTPLMRLGEPKDVANLVEFLASDSSSFITGQIITVDGGFTL